MKFLIQFLIIIAFSFAGELLHFLLPLPIPASIYGIVLLFAALELKIVKVKHIRETSGFLIAIMPVMFIPAAVGLIDSWQSIGSSWLQYIVVTVVSTFVVMGVSGWITQAVIRRGKKPAEAVADKLGKMSADKLGKMAADKLGKEAQR